MAANKKNERKGKIDLSFNELYEAAELPEPSELEVMQRKYIQWMHIHNFSQKTIETQRFHMAKFLKWCNERGLLSPKEITRPILELFHGHISRSHKATGKAYGVAYINTTLSYLRSFFKWLARYNHILYNPASELELPRLVRHIPHNVLSIPEVETIMMQVDLSLPLGLRDRAIMETLYSTGMRRFELCQLNHRDIFRDTGVILVREGKGRKDRMIPIGERALAWIEKYKNDLRPSLVREQDEGALFLTRKGGPFTPTTLSKLIKTHLKACGIEKEGACHIFRHTMATLMLENGADIRYIQQILGHASLDTTQIYTHVSIKKLKEVYSTTHPAAHLKPNPVKPPKP